MICVGDEFVWVVARLQLLRTQNDHEKLRLLSCEIYTVSPKIAKRRAQRRALRRSGRGSGGEFRRGAERRPSGRSSRDTGRRAGTRASRLASAHHPQNCRLFTNEGLYSLTYDTIIRTQDQRKTTFYIRSQTQVQLVMCINAA